MRSPRPVAEAENRLERFNEHRERILREVESRICARLFEHARRGGEASLEYVLNDVAFHEIRRLESSPSRNHQRQLARWRELAGRLGRLSTEDAQREIERLVAYYARDVVGNFNPRVYRFASDVLPPALSLLFSPLSSLRDGVAALGDFGDQVQAHGPLDHIRELCERGTLVVTPTHSSNMDSIVVALALLRAKLPPVTYGAGKNLFTNPFISFFMRNLGAYRVDRRLRFGLYKEVLKEYSTVLLEHGYHSLFFPGGTRSRSNMVEQHLKLGLLGTVVKAFQNNVRAGKINSRIYIVPVTINYRLVLEAETLIDDFLAEQGKSRYIITDDEFSRLGRIVEFIRKTMVLEDACIVRFGTPLDPFGNVVDEAGDSVDRRGRVIDPATYVENAAGEVVADDQRDSEYTRLCGRQLAGSFLESTVFHATSLVTRVLYDAVVDRVGTRDIYRLLRLASADMAIPLREVRAGVERLRRRIADEPAWGRIAGEQRPVADVVDDAVMGLVTYHTRPVVSRTADAIRISDMKLLYYYQNRTAHIPREEGRP